MLPYIAAPWIRHGVAGWVFHVTRLAQPKAGLKPTESDAPDMQARDGLGINISKRALGKEASRFDSRCSSLEGSFLITSSITFYNCNVLQLIFSPWTVTLISHLHARLARISAESWACDRQAEAVKIPSAVKERCCWFGAWFCPAV